MKESKRRKNGQKCRGAGKNGGGTGKRRTKRADKTDGITAPPEGPERLCAASSARARVRGVSLAPGAVLAAAFGCVWLEVASFGSAKKANESQKSQKGKDKDKIKIKTMASKKGEKKREKKAEKIPGEKRKSPGRSVYYLREILPSPHTEGPKGSWPLSGAGRSSGGR